MDLLFFENDFSRTGRLNSCDRPAEPCWTPEVLRVDAELLLRSGGDRKRAEEMLRESLRLAREQDAGLWQRRAESALAKLLVAAA